MKKSSKTILVGIDYTKSSDNAVEYAAKLAERGKASLLLFHIYEAPVIHTNSGIYFISYKSIWSSNKIKLEKYQKKIQLKHPKVNIETFTTSNSFEMEIEKMIQRRKIDYIVLGMETKSRISKFIYGSHSTTVAGKVSCPVIIVPEKYRTKSYSKAAFSVDNYKTIGERSLKKVSDFADQFKFKVNNIHIRTQDEIGLEPAVSQKIKVNLIEATDFPDGISKYVKANSIDLVIILSQSHSALYNFFNETNTKKIAFQSKVPVMAIHG